MWTHSVQHRPQGMRVFRLPERWAWAISGSGELEDAWTCMGMRIEACPCCVERHPLARRISHVQRPTSSVDFECPMPQPCQSCVTAGIGGY